MKKRPETNRPQTTKVMACACAHAYQDGRYGGGMRLHNRAPTVGSPEKRKWVCTVCGRAS